MTANDRKLSGEIPEDVLQFLREAPPVSMSMAKLAESPLDLLSDPLAQAEHAKAMVVEAVLEAMEEQGINQNELAARLGKSRQWISRILREKDNFTIETIARLAVALGLHATVKLCRRGERLYSSYVGSAQIVLFPICANAEDRQAEFDLSGAAVESTPSWPPQEFCSKEALTA